MSVTIYKDKSVKLDSDDDGFYEFLMIYNGVWDGQAFITITGIHEKIISQEEKPVKEAVCGDSVCEGNETKQNCCTDCGCGLSEECKENMCVVTQKAVQSDVRKLLILSLMSLLILGIVIYYMYHAAKNL